jgi:hypothetical protein
MDDGELLAAARQIHEELAVGEHRDGLGRLIQEARQAEPGERRQESVDQIYELLYRDERTRRRLNELLAPVRDVPRLYQYQSLAGDPQSSDDSFDRLVCPQGDYAWPILDVSDPTPQPTVCPNDGAPLAFRPAGS